MAQHYSTDVRRNRISNLIEDEPLKYDLEHPQIIATALDLDYDTVKNDIKVIREKYQQINKKYNLAGLAISYRKKHERMEELRAEAETMVKESDGKNKMEAMHLEMSIMNNMYHLESDGINPIIEELEAKEAATKDADELEN